MSRTRGPPSHSAICTTVFRSVNSAESMVRKNTSLKTWGKIYPVGLRIMRCVLCIGNFSNYRSQTTFLWDSHISAVVLERNYNAWLNIMLKIFYQWYVMITHSSESGFLQLFWWLAVITHKCNIKNVYLWSSVMWYATLSEPDWI